MIRRPLRGSVRTLKARLPLCLGLTSALLASPRPAAAECKPPSDAQVQARIAELDAIFEDHAPAMDLWWTGFLGLHATMAAAMSVVQNYQSDAAREETAVGIVGSALGATTLFLVTPPLLEAEAALVPLPRDTPAARRRYLAQAERLLAEQARKSRFADSWLARGIAFAYTTGAALFVWFALDRPLGALRNFVGGLVIGQGRIMLHPTGAADAWDEYRAHYVEGCGAPRPPRRAAPDPGPGLELGLGGAPGGLALTVRF